MVWKRSRNIHADLPSPIVCRLKEENEHMRPLMTGKLPAPVATIDICSCKCTKGCISGRCSCKRKKLACTKMCLCENCLNENNEYCDSEADVTDSDNDV